MSIGMPVDFLLLGFVNWDLVGVTSLWSKVRLEKLEPERRINRSPRTPTPLTLFFTSGLGCSSVCWIYLPSSSASSWGLLSVRIWTVAMPEALPSGYILVLGCVNLGFFLVWSSLLLWSRISLFLLLWNDAILLLVSGILDVNTVNALQCSSVKSSSSVSFDDDFDLFVKVLLLVWYCFYFVPTLFLFLLSISFLE